MRNEFSFYGFHRCHHETCPYNVEPLKPHFYVLNLGFTGVYMIFFLFLLKNIDCGYSLEPPRRGDSNEKHNLCFEVTYEKYQKFYLKIFIFWRYISISVFLNRLVFVMCKHQRIGHKWNQAQAEIRINVSRHILISGN